MPVSELVKDKTPVEIMHIINELIGVMSAKGALIYDENDESWFIHHLEYNQEIDEIFYLSDTKQ